MDAPENWVYRRFGLSDRLSHPALFVAGLVILSAFVSMAIGVVAVRGTVVVWPIAGLAIVAGILLGSVGIAAITLGHLAGVTVIGTLDLTAVFTAASLLLAGYVAAFLWRHGIVLPVAGGVQIKSIPGRFLVTIVIASISGGAAMAWGGEMTRHAPFFVGLRYTVGYALTGVVIGFPLWYVLHRIWFAGGDPPDVEAPLDRGRSITVAGLSIGWLVLGTLTSAGYRWIRTILTRFPYAFESRSVGGLLWLYDDAVFGIGGSRIQVVLGGTMGSLLVLTLLGGRTDRSERNR